MLRFPLFALVLLVGLSIIIAKNTAKYPHRHQKRSARNHEQFRMLRHLMGKLIDTESNAIYTIDGQKQHEAPINAEPSPPLPPSMIPNVHPTREEIACLAACHSCVEDYPIGNVDLFTIIFDWIDLACSVFSSSWRKRQPIIVVQCVIVQTAVFVYRSSR